MSLFHCPTHNTTEHVNQHCREAWMIQPWAGAGSAAPFTSVTLTNLMPQTVLCRGCGETVGVYPDHNCTVTRIEFEALKLRLAQLLDAHGENL